MILSNLFKHFRLYLISIKLVLEWHPTTHCCPDSHQPRNSRNIIDMLVLRSKKTIGISTRYNPSSILSPDKHPMSNLKSITQYKFPQPTITSIPKTYPKIHPNYINPSGFIWIDMCSDSTASSRKVLLREMAKMKETEKSRYCSILKITLFL